MAENNNSKKTNYGLILDIVQSFDYIQSLFEEPLSRYQKELILKDGLIALTQMLIQQPFGECSLSTLYDDSEINTQARELIQDLPRIWELLEIENGV